MKYLACPYTHKNLYVRNTRFTTANQVAAILMQRGEIIFSPLSHSVPIDNWVDNGDHDFWLRQDREFLNVCDELLVLTLDGWKSSFGVRWEIKYMTSKGKPVTYIDEDANEIFPN